jgi:hypothetical protein
MLARVDAVIDPNPLHVLADVAQKEEGLQATARNPNLGALMKWRSATAEFLFFSDDISEIVTELEQYSTHRSWRKSESKVSSTCPDVVDWAGEMVTLLMRRAPFAKIEAVLDKHDVSMRAFLTEPPCVVQFACCSLVMLSLPQGSADSIAHCVGEALEAARAWLHTLYDAVESDVTVAQLAKLLKRGRNIKASTALLATRGHTVVMHR